MAKNLFFASKRKYDEYCVEYAKIIVEKKYNEMTKYAIIVFLFKD